MNENEMWSVDIYYKLDKLVTSSVRPEDDSTYVTTLFELRGFEFLSSKVDKIDTSKNVKNVSWTSEYIYSSAAKI